MLSLPYDTQPFPQLTPAWCVADTPSGRLHLPVVGWAQHNGKLTALLLTSGGLVPATDLDAVAFTATPPADAERL